MMPRKSIGTELSALLAAFYGTRPNEQLEAKEFVKPGEDPVDDNQIPVRVSTGWATAYFRCGQEDWEGGEEKMYVRPRCNRHRSDCE